MEDLVLQRTGIDDTNADCKRNLGVTFENMYRFIYVFIFGTESCLETEISKFLESFKIEKKKKTHFHKN